VLSVCSTPEQNQNLTEIFARDLLCQVTDTACLRSRSVDWIMKVQLLPEYIHSYPGGLHTWEFLVWGPVIDGSFFPGVCCHHLICCAPTLIVYCALEQMRLGIC
jgi:hypothetical protein